jgi:hypothetical protein
VDNIRGANAGNIGTADAGCLSARHDSGSDKADLRNIPGP